jgi:hypothetical protein
MKLICDVEMCLWMDLLVATRYRVDDDTIPRGHGQAQAGEVKKPSVYNSSRRYIFRIFVFSQVQQ